MLFGVGFGELLIILLVLLLVVGPKRLPEMARKAGRMWRSVQRTAQEMKRALDVDVLEDPEREGGVTPWKSSSPTKGTHVIEEKTSNPPKAIDESSPEITEAHVEEVLASIENAVSPTKETIDDQVEQTVSRKENGESQTSTSGSHAGEDVVTPEQKPIASEEIVNERG